MTESIPHKEGRLIIVNHNYDLGDIDKGSSTQCKLLLRNEGLEDITIRRQNQGCRSIIFNNFPARNKSIKSGETFGINFSYNASLMPGRKVHQLSFKVTTPWETYMLETKIKANVIEYVSTSSRHIELIANNQDNQKDMTISSIDGSLFSITNIDITKNLINATFDKNIKSDKHRISFQISNKSIKTRQLGRFTINIAHPKEKKAEVSFVILPEFKSSSRTIRFRNLANTPKATRNVTIANRLNTPFEIKNVTSTKGLLKATISELKNDKYQIYFHFDIPPEYTSNFVKDTLLINIKGRPNSTIHIPCYGRLE